MPDTAEIDFHSPEFVRDPYTTYRALHERTEPFWLPQSHRTGSSGVFLFARYQDAAAILRETQTISKDVCRLLPADRHTALDRMFLNLDPPQHTRLRAIVAPLFSVRRIAQLETDIQAIVDDLLNSINPDTEFEFIQGFAGPLPVRVLSLILGVPQESMARIKRLTDALIAELDSVGSSGQDGSGLQLSLEAVERYLDELISEGEHPDGSLFHHVREKRRSSGMVNSDEILGICLLMLLGGYETTVGLIGNGLLCLLQHPQEMERLRNDPNLLPSAIEEMLRYESPLQRSTFRVATDRWRLGDFVLEEGQQLSCVLGAANRDAGEFESPDDFDISRKPNRHLSFGKGIHKCLGERLAKTEARLAFASLLKRFPDIQLLDTEPRWRENTLFRCLSQLNVRFSASK